MDQSSFDRIARLLGGAITRRAGIGAALGGLLGRAALDADARGGRKGAGARTAGKAANRRAVKQRGRPATEGPCGDGSRKDNLCTKDRDCCTGICNIDSGKRSKDARGRCRCIKKGGACRSNENCCNGMLCSGGLCGRATPSGCSTSAQCPPPSVCFDALCSAGLCTTAPAADGTPCSGGSCLAGACVQCIVDSDCGSAGDCTQFTCTSNACVSSASPDDTTCSTGQCSAGACVQCTTDAGCSNQTTNQICKTSDNTCVECLSDGNCDSSAPACNATTNVCEGCATPTTSNLVTGSPLHTPAGIATDPSSTTQQVWVSNFAYNAAAANAKLGYMKFDGTGLTMGTSVAKGIQGIALSSNKVPFACANDAAAGNVYRFDPSTANPVTPPVCTSTDSAFKSAYGLYVDGDSTSGTLWMTTAGSTATVWKFTIGTDTAPVKVWNTLGSTGRGIKKGPGGWLYACIEGSNKIVVLDPAVANSGSLPSTTKVTELTVSGPFDVVFSGNTMFVNNSGAKKIYRYTITLDNTNVPSASLVCEYAYNQAATFFIGLTPDGAILTPFWGSSRPADGVLEISL